MSKNTSDIKKAIKKRLPARQLFKELYPKNYRESGNSLCPFHEDTDESFSFPKRWPWLGKCHGGCAPDGKVKNWDVFSLWQAKHNCDFPTAVRDLAKKAGIEFSEASQGKKIDLGAPVATYDYHDGDGNVVFRVNRYAITDNLGNPGKTFRQCRPDGNGGWIHNLKGVRLVLFGLPELPKVAPDEPILILEGEKDVFSARRLRFTATCNPGGAGKWSSQCKDHSIHLPLEGRIVWVIPDADEPGRKHADDVARSLRGFARSVKIVELANVPEKGDLTDFVEMMDNDDLARELVIDTATKAAEYRPAWNGPPVVSLHDLMEMDLPEPEWIIPKLLPQGLAISCGPPKIGKSYFVHGATLSIASGANFLGCFPCPPGEVLHLALENNLRRLRWRTSRMLKDQIAPRNAYFACQWPQFSDKDNDPGGLDFIHRWVEEHRDAARMVVVDTFAKIRPRKKIKSDIYERDYADLEGLQLLAGEYGIAVVVVHHLNKGTHADIYNSVSGSSGLTGAADTVMILEKTQRIDAEGTLYLSGRDVEDRKGAVSFDRETGLWQWLGDAADVKTTKERREIREILRSVGRPMKAAEIADLMEPKKSTATVQRTLSRMVEAGEADRSAGQFGKYTLPPEDARYSCGEVDLEHI